MTKRVEEITLGVDVSKEVVEIYGEGFEHLARIGNSERSLREYLSGFGAGVVMAFEATSVYHEVLLEVALELGHEVYVIDGYRLSRYRDAVGVRAKTDALDAQLIHRYLVSERRHLRRVQQGDVRVRQLWRLVKRRAKLVKCRTAIRESFKGLDKVAESGALLSELLATLDRALKELERWAQRLAGELGWTASLSRLRTIPGVGTLGALSLRAMYARGRFRSADAFVAYVGLDVRVRDSGRYRGRRKLTKSGDPEVRRVLFNGARSAANHRADWAELKANYQRQGRSETELSVILSRKLARIAYALLRDGTTYRATSAAVTAS